MIDQRPAYCAPDSSYRLSLRPIGFVDRVASLTLPHSYCQWHSLVARVKSMPSIRLIKRGRFCGSIWGVDGPASFLPSYDVYQRRVED